MKPWLKKGLAMASLSLALSVQARMEPMTLAVRHLDQTLYDMKPSWFDDYDRLIHLPIQQQLEDSAQLPQDSSLRDALLIRWFLLGENMIPSCPSGHDSDYPLFCSFHAVFSGLFGLPITAVQSLILHWNQTGSPDFLLEPIARLFNEAHPESTPQPRSGCQNVALWASNDKSDTPPRLSKTVLSAWLLKRCGAPDTEVNDVLHRHIQRQYPIQGYCADCEQLLYYHQWLQTIPAWPQAHEED